VAAGWRRTPAAAFTVGAGVGVLGGLVGLGGAEFRLPLLMGLFGFAALAAVIMNKAMSLAVVLAAIPARLATVPAAQILHSWQPVAILLAGSLLGAWVGASWATRMATETLHRVLAVLLLLIAVVFAAQHSGSIPAIGRPPDDLILVSLGVLAGFGIGVVAAVMGVAGGELLIPTLVLLYGIDLKLAGSLSLLVSLPTMLVAFARYSRDQAFTALTTHHRFALVMAGGSVAAALLGGLLLGRVPNTVLAPLVVALLLASAIKVWRH
jgi:uncharacterized protein